MHTLTTFPATVLITAGLAAASTQAGDVMITQSDAMSSGGSGTTIATFNLFDHPNGIANPQAYGLRLDSFTNSASPVTFTFEDQNGNSAVQLYVIETDTGLSININGTITGNSALGGQDYGSFLLDLTYHVDSESVGWEDNDANAGQLIGGLTGLSTTASSPLGNGDFLALSAMSDGNDTFKFLADGFRNMGSLDQWVGRGWVSSDLNNGQGVNDLLFTAQIVPLPPAALGGIAMLAGLGVCRRMRNRKS